MLLPRVFFKALKPVQLRLPSDWGCRREVAAELAMNYGMICIVVSEESRGLAVISKYGAWIENRTEMDARPSSPIAGMAEGTSAISDHTGNNNLTRSPETSFWVRLSDATSFWVRLKMLRQEPGSKAVKLRIQLVAMLTNVGTVISRRLHTRSSKCVEVAKHHIVPETVSGKLGHCTVPHVSKINVDQLLPCTVVRGQLGTRCCCCQAIGNITWQEPMNILITFIDRE